MNEATQQLFSNLNALVTGLFLLSSFGIVAMRQVRGCLFLFIIQSVLLAISAILLGFQYHTIHLFGVAIVNIVSKAIVVPLLLKKTTPSEIYTRREVSQVLNIPTALLIALALTVLSYFLSKPLLNSVAPEFQAPNIAIGIAGLLLGAFTITVRREAVPLLLGLLAMENGAFLAGIAIARTLPLIVELAVATDGLIIVFIIGVLTRGIQKRIGTTAIGELSSLKEMSSDLGEEAGK